MNDSTFIDPIIKLAQSLGALTPAAIFAFMWLWQAIKELRKENAERKIRDKENERREHLILADERQTDALRTMAKNLMMLKDAHNTTTIQLTALNTILSERIPRK